MNTLLVKFLSYIGHLSAQHYLGWIYEEGKGLKRDNYKSCMRYKKSSEMTISMGKLTWLAYMKMVLMYIKVLKNI